MCNSDLSGKVSENKTRIAQPGVAHPSSGQVRNTQPRERNYISFCFIILIKGG